MFAEDLWQGIRGFAWRCSMRCWVHVLARNAGCRYLRAPHRRRERNLSPSEHPMALAHVAAAQRHTAALRAGGQRQDPRATPALERQRSDLTDPIALPFREVALVMHEGPLDGLPREREAARLRKRFERLKSELRRTARAEGLLPR